MPQRSHDSYAAQQLSSLREGDSYFLGVDIGGTSLRVALADAAGNIVAKWSASTVGVRDAQTVVSMISDGADQLFLETSIPRTALRAIAAGAPGVTDVNAGIVIATSYLMGWRNVPLRELLENIFHLPVAIDNDVNLAALGEGWIGAGKGQPDFVFIAIGTGVGAGIVLNGQLLRGRGWLAGEIGYMLVPGTSLEPAGNDMPGGLESFIGGEGIRSRWQTAWSRDTNTLPATLVATEIFDHAVEGNPLACRILDETARVLAYCIYNLALVLNCPLFILGGSVGVHAALCAAVQRRLDERRAQVNPTLIHSGLGSDAQLIGALRLAMSVDAERSETRV